MRKENLEVIANEVTKNCLGRLDNYADEDMWYAFRDGVKAGILEGRNLHNEVLNQAMSMCNRPQKPDNLKRAINALRAVEGLDKEFVIGDEE